MGYINFEVRAIELRKSCRSRLHSSRKRRFYDRDTSLCTTSFSQALHLRAQPVDGPGIYLLTGFLRHVSVENIEEKVEMYR